MRLDECACFECASRHVCSTHARGDGAGFAYSGRLSRSSLVAQGPYARQGCGLQLRVGSGVQPSVGVGDVLDDNGVLRCWQPRAHALQRRPPTIGILRREQLDVSQLQRAVLHRFAQRRAVSVEGLAPKTENLLFRL